MSVLENYTVQAIAAEKMAADMWQEVKDMGYVEEIPGVLILRDEYGTEVAWVYQ